MTRILNGTDDERKDTGGGQNHQDGIIPHLEAMPPKRMQWGLRERIYTVKLLALLVGVLFDLRSAKQS